MAIIRARVRSGAIEILALGAMVVSASGCSNAGSGTAANTVESPSAPSASGVPESIRSGVIPLPTDLPLSIDYEDAMRLFEYDRARAFDLVEKSVRDKDGVAIHDITYVQASGSRTQTYLVVPPGAGQFGGVMYLHGAYGGSSDFLDEAVDLANHGVVSLLINQPEWKLDPSTHAEAVTEIVFEMRELRRSLDLLASRPEVDPDRLGFVGFSFGAIRGGTFAGIEGKRLKIAILMSTPPSYGLSYMAPFDPIVWAQHVSPAALYVQEGTQDGWFTHAEAESLVAAAQEPKKLAWYEAGHGLNKNAYDDRLGWLETALRDT
jgi:dienelactone hydrolase